MKTDQPTVTKETRHPKLATFISKNRGAVDGGSGEIDVQVGGEMRLLEGRLDDAGSLPARWRKTRLQRYLQTCQMNREKMH